MIQKSKSKSNSFAELNFVSSLQLEQSVILIGDIADDYHQVTLTEVSSDEFKFHIDYLSEKFKVAEIKGTVQRWNGTETKLDANGEVLRLEASNSTKSQTEFVLSRIFLTFVGLGIAVFTGLGWLAVPIFIALGVSLYTSIDKLDENPQTILFRHRDYLLQRLIDAFKSAGDVEAL